MTCPVPKEQQPLNEYIELKEAFFYRWAKLARSQYLRVLVLMWLGFAILFSPVAMSIESPADLAKDRLLVTYEIKPVMTRLQKTLLVIIVFLVLSISSLNFFS